MSTQPPALAMWLLSRLATGPHADALIGDLVEAHARGRSATWFWGQTVGAIGAGFASEVRSNLLGLLLVAFFGGFGGAAALGTITIVPGIAVVDAVVAAFGAGWLACRFGGPAATFVLALLVLVFRSPVAYGVVMAVLDHFGGLWLIAHHATAALPSSIVLAEAVIIMGALAGARPRHSGRQTPVAA